MVLFILLSCFLVVMFISYLLPCDTVSSCFILFPSIVTIFGCSLKQLYISLMYMCQSTLTYVIFCLQLSLAKEACFSFEDIDNPNQGQKEASQVVALAPNSIIQAVSRNPYSFSTKKFPSQEFVLSDSPERGKKANKSKQRSRSMWGNKTDKHDTSILKESAKTATINLPKSSSSDASARTVTSPLTCEGRFAIPREVFLIPLWQPDRKGHKLSPGLLEFELLSEEEVIGGIL